MALAAFCRFLHAVVAEFRRVFQGLRHAFTVHQLAAQGGDEHITRAMQRLRKAGLENFHILPVQPRAVADLLPAVDAAETMLDGSLTLLMLGENQKLENTSTCKNLYRYNSQRPLAGVLLDTVKRMVYPSFKRE